MRFDFLKRSVLIILLIACLYFCGCDKQTNESSSLNASFEFEAVADDLADPQNTENSTEGAIVTADEITPQTGKALGIDVSKWQGAINWKQVKKSGIEFAIIRIGYRAENGKLYKDSNADYNLQQADKNGILVGVYFFSTAISEAEGIEEAKWTASMIEGYPISYPVVYDCEGFSQYDSRMKHLTVSQRTKNAVAFLDYIEKAGYEGMFYSSITDLLINWEKEVLETKYKIWVAHYPEITYPEIKNPDYSGKYHMWQYTNNGSVSGILGNTDMVVSYFKNEKAEPKKIIKIEEAAVPTEKNNIYSEVNETVTAKDEVNLRDGAGVSFNIVGSLKNGDTLTRVATGSNGWSKLLLNGKTVYAISSYLTTDLTVKPPKTEQPELDNIYTEVNETVTAKDQTNLRTEPTTKGNSQVVYTLKNGETVIRTGIGSNNWSRLIYNGQTVYAVSSYLTTDLSYKPPVDLPAVDNSMQFTELNEQVTAKSETNLRTIPSTDGDSQVVYTLKNGEFITRTGISEKGWSRLNYNGQTVYAVSSYLIKKDG